MCDHGSTFSGHNREVSFVNGFARGRPPILTYFLRKGDLDDFTRTPVSQISTFVTDVFISVLRVPPEKDIFSVTPGVIIIPGQTERGGGDRAGSVTCFTSPSSSSDDVTSVV